MPWEYTDGRPGKHALHEYSLRVSWTWLVSRAGASPAAAALDIIGGMHQQQKHLLRASVFLVRVVTRFKVSQSQAVCTTPHLLSAGQAAVWASTARVPTLVAAASAAAAATAAVMTRRRKEYLLHATGRAARPLERIAQSRPEKFAGAAIVSPREARSRLFRQQGQKFQALSYVSSPS